MDNSKAILSVPRQDQWPRVSSTWVYNKYDRRSVIETAKKSLSNDSLYFFSIYILWSFEAILFTECFLSGYILISYFSILTYLTNNLKRFWHAAAADTLSSALAHHSIVIERIVHSFDYDGVMGQCRDQCISCSHVRATSVECWQHCLPRNTLKARLHRRFFLRSFPSWCMRLNGLTYECIRPSVQSYINQYFCDSTTQSHASEWEKSQWNICK